MLQEIDGVLILDKPEGISSNQALQKAKRLFHAKKAGHTGTLDLMATGLLPIALGEATKYCQYLLNADKVYRVVVQLGERTSTGDSEGEVIEKHPVTVNLKEVNAVLKNFIGDLEQVPPMHSALKQNGQPLYKLARKGISVLRKPRQVHVYSLELLDWQGDSFSFDVTCSKGTYVRTLTDDIGVQLGCGAYVLSLRRLVAGAFDASQMLTLEKLETIKAQDGLDALRARLLPIDTMLAGFSALQIDESVLVDLRHGKKAKIDTATLLPGMYYRLYAEEKFCGLGQALSEEALKAQRLLSA